MNATNLRLKILNILYVLFLLSLLSIFFINLFSSYDYSSWQISEFLINYQGGFVRRGLLGELLFFFVKHFGIDIVWTIKVLSLICCTSVCLFFVISFLKKGYTLYILPLCFFCGGIIMSEVWIRKDFLMVGFFILILMVYIQKRLPFWLKILLINLLSIFIILTHEVFAFFALPVLFLLLFNFFHEKRKIYASIGFSLAVLFPSILTFLLVTVNHGDQTTVQAIWDSWSAISGKEIIRIPGNNAVDAIGWPGIDTLFFHFRINFLLEEFYILSIWYWLIVFPVVYYISTNAFSVFKKRPEVYTENDRTILSSILCFQLLCLSPLFVCLSIDYIRLFFYLTASSFALFLMVPQNVLANLFPVLPVQLIKKINKGFDLVLPPSKTTLAFLMLIVGISYSGFTLKTIWMSTMVYRIFLLFSEPVILFRDFFLN